MNKHLGLIKSFTIIPLIFLIASCKPSITSQNSPRAAIVCFGASITQGVGADKGHDYPAVLSHMVKVPVINAGIKANTTRDELKRLERDVLQENPQMVIITHRINDLNHNILREETLKNLEMMIDQVQSCGATAVLVTIEPRELQGTTYFKDFGELARRKHVLYIGDILKDIQTNPQYMKDDIHPNNEGYKLMAERVYTNIKPLLK
ncbi:MAG: hypothetical protein HQL26_10155 [Candidatus Omnitrophica bacterium]|nr:hypothetical protein [Candidatus Omnitrophota bacterium]